MNFCPEGSGLPQNVTLGWFSTGGNATTRSNQEKCRVDGFVRPSREYTVGTNVDTLNNCPSRTRVTVDEENIRNRPHQTVDKDYNIDPENEFRYNFEYPDNV